MAKRIRAETEDDEILASYERDEWKPVAKVREEVARYQAYAAAMLETNRQVSVTLPLTDSRRCSKRLLKRGCLIKP